MRWGWVGVAVAAFVFVAVMWIGNDRAAGEDTFDDFSVENTSNTGLSLAFRYLQRAGHRAARLDEPLRPKVIPNDAVLLRIGKLMDASFFNDEETDEKHAKRAKRLTPVAPLLTPFEDDWVRGGGRLVLASDDKFGPIEFRVEPREKVAKKVFPIWPQLDTISPPVARQFSERTLPSTMHSVFTQSGAPVVARQTIGRGEVFLIAVPEIFQNQHLRARNGVLLLTALAGTNRPVYFDESIHGFEASDGAVALMKEWGLGPFLVALALIGIVFFWRNATSIGPREDDYRETRSDAVDLVRSLGALYRSATNDDEAIAMYREALTRSVAAQTGLRGDALHQRVATLIGSPRAGRVSFKQQLDALNEAFKALAGGHHHAKHR